MGFCISLLAHLLFCIVFVIYVFVKSLGGTILEVLENCAIIIIIFAISVFFFVSLGYLVGYQLNLLKKGINMNEDLKELYRKSCHRPFEIGDLCFRTNAPSLQEERYLYRAWNELISISSNAEASTDRTHHTPLLGIPDTN